MGTIATTHNLNDLLGDTRRTNNFIMTIDGVMGDDNRLELVIDKAFLPKISLKVIELRHGNDAIKFAGEATWEGGQVVIFDTLSQDELDAVIAWFKSTYDWENNGAIGLASEYKKSATINEYAANGSHMRSWDIVGCWISDLDLGTLDASTADLKKISFTIQIDPSKGMGPTYSGYSE